MIELQEKICLPRCFVSCAKDMLEIKKCKLCEALPGGPGGPGGPAKKVSEEK